MKINAMYFYSPVVSPYEKENKTSFGGAKDISLRYVWEHRRRLLPERIRRKVGILVSKNKETPTLRDLHLQTYAELLDCKNLAKAQNIYPEFRGVLQANAVVQKGSKNIRKIEEKVSLKDFSLYILKERWGKLKTEDEIAKELGLKNRSALGWVLDKIHMPNPGKNYLALLKSSDEVLNRSIAEKVKAFNREHPEKIIEHNRLLAQRPEIVQMNKELADEMWERMPEVKEEMSRFRRDNPHIKRADFYEAFWAAYPGYKELMSVIRKEIGAARRAERMSEKSLSKNINKKQ